MRRWLPGLVIVALLAGPAHADDRQVRARREIAAILVDFASWCVNHRLYAEARPLLQEVLAVAPGNRKAQALVAVAVGDSTATAADRREYVGKLRRRKLKLRKLYPLLSAKLPVVEAPVVEAPVVEPRPPPPPVVEPEIEPQPVHGPVKATTHDMLYYVSLPRGWSAKKSWPILVGIEGADCNWELMVKFHERARGDRPFIIVVPITFTNTNGIAKYRHKYPYTDKVIAQANRDRLQFDESGIFAVLDDVRRRYHGQDKFFITGYSGGGITSLWMALRYPDKLMAAAAACPNFNHIGGVSSAPEHATLPVMVFQGDKDRYLHLMDPQWERLKRFFDHHGFKVGRQFVAGLGHHRCPDQVLEFFNRHLTAEPPRP